MLYLKYYINVIVAIFQNERPEKCGREIFYFSLKH